MSDTSSGHHLAPAHQPSRHAARPGREPARHPKTGASSTAGDAALLLLTTGAPNEVLARIAGGDPLGLAARLVRRAAARALLVEPAQLFARGAAHCARRARDYRGRPRPSLWLERRAEEVVRSIERGAGRAVVGASRTGAHGTELERAAARFNTCARSDREALWRLAFAGSTLDEQARELGCSLSDVARRARRALDALLAGGVIDGGVIGGSVIEGSVIEGSAIEGSAIDGSVIAEPRAPSGRTGRSSDERASGEVRA